MKKLHHALLYFISLFILNLINIFFLFKSIITFNNDKSEDNIVILICFILLLIMNSYQLLSIYNSKNNKENNISSLLYDKNNILQKNVYIAINVLLVIIILGLILNFILLFNKDLFLTNLPYNLKLLINNFFFLILINIVFIDLYIKVK
ncbi:MAG: hypothetical protein ACTTID_03075 [Bacillales bacterium]